jgi:hypothetical protein
MLAPLVAAFQLASSQPTAYHGRNGQIVVRAPAADDEVVIDGRLDEPVWRGAALLTGFSLYQPVDQRPAPDSTEVLVWYSPGAIYFGIRAFEPHGPVRATLADRDRIGADDNVEIHLDTFDERRRAFVFIVNPLGVQADGRRSEGGGFTPGSNVGPGQNDLSADFFWESRGRVTDWGYEVEIRIPFRSLRYPALATQQWGIQIDRHVQHSGYEETWTPARKGSASFIGQAGWLTGLTGLRHGQVTELNPELTNTITGTPCCAGAGPAWHYASDPRLGGNVRWGMGSNFVLNGTVKPDFSQVEADATQIAADARFALFYPEKRPFFVEGAERFNVPNTLVYTRALVRPDAAGKLTGTIGRADVAVLSALDEGQTTATGERPLANIVRLQRAFGEQSTAGFLYSERVGGGRENRAAGGDMRIVFGQLYFAQFQAVASATRDTGATRTAPMWEAVVDRTGRHFGFHYNLLGIHPDFRADNGFVPRTGFVAPSISNRYTAFGPPGSVLERYTGFVTTNAYWRYGDFFAGRHLLEDKLSANNSLTFRGGWSLSATPALASFAFDPAAYAGVRSGSALAPVPFVPSGRTTTFVTSGTFSTPQFPGFSASVGGAVGNDVDFLETSRVRRSDYNATADVRPSQRLRLNATYASTSFRRRSDGERTVSTRIPRVKVEYQVTRSVFVRLVGQYEAIARAPLGDPRTGEILLTRASDGTFQPSAARASNTLRADGLFSYRPSPGTVFFAGYGSSLTENASLAFDGLRRTGDGFFVKASYLFGTRPPN